MNFKLWKFTRCLFRANKTKRRNQAQIKRKLLKIFKLVSIKNLKFQVKRFEFFFKKKEEE